MVVNYGHVVFAQVRQLVGNVNKKNFKATSGELNQVRILARADGHQISPGAFCAHITAVSCQVCYASLAIAPRPAAARGH
jgi:hypothetical protein